MFRPRLREPGPEYHVEAPWRTKDRFNAVWARAYALADTGRFTSWDDLAVGLIEEGANEPLVRRLGRDRLAVIMLSNRMKAAREQD